MDNVIYKGMTNYRIGSHRTASNYIGPAYTSDMDNVIYKGMTNYRIGSHRTASNYIGPCLQTRDRNFKSEAKKRRNYLQDEQATRHAVRSLQLRLPQKQH